MMRSDFDIVSACASVLATTKSTPCSPAVIMLLTAFPPAPPTPNTVIRGFNSRMSGIFRLIVMAASPECGRENPQIWPVRHRPAWFLERGSLEALAEPSSDPCQISVGSGHRRPQAPRLELFEMGELRI